MRKVSRLKKCINRRKITKHAEWVQMNLQDPNLMQYITDCMNYGYAMQIDYENSGWRTIYPYGFNTSKEGNVLIMCYKDSGEVRSYRFDKIFDMYINYADNSFENGSEEEQQYEDQNINELLIFEDQNNELEDFPIIEDDTLNDSNNIEDQNEQGVYDDIIYDFGWDENLEDEGDVMIE